MSSSRSNPAVSLASGQSSTFSRIPPNLVFLVRVDSLRPDYNVQENRAPSHPQGFWAPPNIHAAYTRRNGPLYRWRGGRMTIVGQNDPVWQFDLRQPGFQYRAATVFTQKPDTDHLLAVDFDAETRDVAEEPRGWKVLTFDHVTSGGNGTYSYVDVVGGEQHLAAHGSDTWLPQLMPVVYDFQAVNTDGRPLRPATQSAGLIGSLPLLIALAAFSAPPDSLAAAMSSVQPGMWQPHQLHSGRSVSERGMVVTIFYDPSDRNHSTQALLDRLQNGGYGPFYR